MNWDKEVFEAAQKSVTRYNDKDEHIQYRMRRCGELSFTEGAEWAKNFLQVERINASMISDIEWIQKTLKEMDSRFRSSIMAQQQTAYSIEFLKGVMWERERPK